MITVAEKLDIKKDYKTIIANHRGEDKSAIRDIFYTLIDEITATGLAGYFDVGSREFDELYRIALYLAIKYQDYANANNIIQSYKKENDRVKRYAPWYYRYAIIVYACRLPRYFIEKPKKLKKKAVRYLKLAKSKSEHDLLAKTLKWHLTYLECLLKDERRRDKYRDIFTGFYQTMLTLDFCEEYTKQLNKLNDLVSGKIDWEEYVNIDQDLILEEETRHPETYDETDKIIVIIGDSEVKPQQILGIAKNYGYQKENVELYLDYSKLTNLKFSKFQYNDKIDGIIIGPVPHSSKDKGNYSSIIQTLTEEDGYPRVIKCQTETGNLKITKSALHNALKELKSYAMAIA